MTRPPLLSDALMPSTEAIPRRSALGASLGVTAAAALGARPASAAAKGKYDLMDPETNLKALLKLQGDLAEKDVISGFGGEAWAAEGWRPMPLLQLTGGNLQGMQTETLVSFPSQIRRAYAKWVVANVRIDGKPYQLAQGTNPGQSPVNFYFDEAGLLTRVVRWSRTLVGSVPSQMDFSDYRDVGGVKVPFETLLTWTDGQNTIKLTDVKLNVAIDAARFAKPAPFGRR